MKVFRIDKMCVHGQEGGKNDDIWIFAPVLGIGEGPIGRAGEYEMILNPEMLIKGSAGKDLSDKIVEEETKQ